MAFQNTSAALFYTTHCLRRTAARGHLHRKTPAHPLRTNRTFQKWSCPRAPLLHAFRIYPKAIS
eukprot:3106023-Alexandrium_andersonii.AAC.1